MPQIVAPLEQLAVHLRQTPAVHQAKEADRQRPMRIGLVPAARSIAKMGVVVRPVRIQRVAEVEWRHAFSPAGRFPFALTRHPQLRRLARKPLLAPVFRQPAVQLP